jgi:hypothetical protein
MTFNEELASSTLERFDALTRPARAARLVWLSQFQDGPAAVMGRMESLDLLEQSRVCYLHGFYVAVLLTSTAFIEQTLIEELEYHNDTSPRHTFELAISAARKAKLLPDNVLDATDKLRVIRNPWTHKKADSHEHRLHVRMQKEQRHPLTILEEDAQSAIQTMYAAFYATLKNL